MFGKNKKTAAPLAPNDPRRIPVEHRELVNNMIQVLTDKGYTIFEAQIVIQALSALRSVETTKFADAVEALHQLGTMVASVKDAPQMLQAILEILGHKMTESLNKLNLGDLKFDNFKL